MDNEWRDQTKTERLIMDFQGIHATLNELYQTLSDAINALITADHEMVTKMRTLERSIKSFKEQQEKDKKEIKEYIALVNKQQDLIKSLSERLEIMKDIEEVMNKKREYKVLTNKQEDLIKTLSDRLDLLTEIEETMAKRKKIRIETSE